MTCVHPVQDFSNLEERARHGRHPELHPELQEWMHRMQTMLSKLEMSSASQSSLLLDLQTSVKALYPSGPHVPHVPQNFPPAAPQVTPAVPSDMPMQLDDLESPEPDDPDFGSASHQLPGSKSRVSGGSSKLEEFLGKDLSVPSNLQELEEHRASQLLSCFRPQRHRISVASASVIPQACVQPEVTTVTSPNAKSIQKTSSLNSKVAGEEKAQKAQVLSRGKMSMDELRCSYNTVVAKRARDQTLDTPEALGQGTPNSLLSQTSLPCVGRFLLCLVGQMHFSESVASRCYAIWSYAMLPFAVTLLLLCVADVESKWSFTVLATLCCFQIGISVASHSLKRNGIGLLFGPTDYQLDDYAQEAGFMQDWQKLSRRRLVEALGTFAVLMLLMVIVNLLLGDSFMDFFGSRWAGWQGWQTAMFNLAFCFMLFRYVMLCYCILHIASGFELALDSFSLRFFQNMDIEAALEEWNVLQATLRQVSAKLNDCLPVMGFCCLASVALLVEQVIFNTDAVAANKMQWILKFYPLAIFLLYTILRAAAVTEKAGRVAPLVNSWKFQEVGGVWMDHGRQYAVQYIIQSKAGFYLNGAQLTFPQLKMPEVYVFLNFLAHVFSLSILVAIAWIFVFQDDKDSTSYHPKDPLRLPYLDGVWKTKAAIGAIR